MENEVKKETPKIKEPNKGVVTNCHLLNLRTFPNEEATVAVILPALTEVVIDPNYFDKIYYRVVVPSLLRKYKFAGFPFEKFYHGYCMKKYISIKR